MILTGIRKRDYEKLDDKYKASQLASFEKRESIALKAKQRYIASKASKTEKTPDVAIDPLTEIITQQKTVIIPAEESLNTVHYPTIIEPTTEQITDPGYAVRGTRHPALAPLILQQDPHEIISGYDKNTGGSKEYAIINVNTFLKRALKDNNMYEVLTGNVYPFIDIDCNDITVNAVELLTNAVKGVMDCLKTHGITVIRPVVSCSTSDVKISYHVVFHTDIVFKNASEFGVFIKKHLKTKYDNDKYNSYIDCTVYNKNRCFRFLNQSKKGKGVCFKKDTISIDGIEYGGRPDIDYIIGQYDKKLPVYYIDTTIQPKISVAKKTDAEVATNNTNSTEITDIDINYYDKIAYLLPDSYIFEYDTWFKFIRAMVSANVPSDIIHKHCMRTSNYDKKEVDKKINEALTINPVTMGTLIFDIKKGPNKKQLATLTKEYKRKQNTPAEPYPNDNLTQEVYNERYVKPFSFDKVSTIILSSQMGTGKTTQIRKLIREGGYQRICVISARRSFGQFFKGDMKIDIDPLILEEDESDEYHNCQRAQHEQDKKDAQFVYYTDDNFTADANRIIIQLESIHKLKNVKPFDMVIMDESESILAQCSSAGTHKDHIDDNMQTFEKIARDAVDVLWADAFIGPRTLDSSKLLRPGKTLHIINENIPTVRNAIQLFRMGVNKTSILPAIDEMHNRIIDDLSKGMRIIYMCCLKTKGNIFIKDVLCKLPDTKYIQYNADIIDEDKSLADVNNHWDKVQLVIYTPSITIGTSYDNVEMPFDKLYLFASASSCVPRDIAQGLFRARIITSNTLVYTVCNKIIDATDSSNIKLIEKRNDNNTTTHNSSTGRTDTIALWRLHLEALNEQERGMKNGNYTPTLHRYLEQSGYSLTHEEVDVKDEKRTIDKPLWTHIEDMTEYEYKNLTHKTDKSLEDKDRICKYRFNKQMKPVCDTCMNDLYADAQTKASFWRMVSEKHNTCHTILKNENALAQDRKGLKYLAMTKLYKLLNIDNCGYGFKVDVKSILPGLASLEQTAYDAFTANGCRRNKNNAFTEDNGAQMIKMMFAGWNGDKVKIDFVVGYKKTKIYSCEKDNNNTYCLITDVAGCKIKFNGTGCRNAQCIESECDNVYKPEDKPFIETVKCIEVATVKVATMIKQSKATINKTLIKNELCKNDRELKPKKR